MGQRVPSLRLIAGHLSEVAAFLEALDHSIETEEPKLLLAAKSQAIPVSGGGGGVAHRVDHASNSLASISENPEGYT